jgi:hypothetical protein
VKTLFPSATGALHGKAPKERLEKPKQESSIVMNVFCPSQTYRLYLLYSNLSS